LEGCFNCEGKMTLIVRDYRQECLPFKFLESDRQARCIGLIVRPSLCGRGGQRSFDRLLIANDMLMLVLAELEGEPENRRAVRYTDGGPPLFSKPTRFQVHKDQN
jgi:hypothetical protein